MNRLARSRRAAPAILGGLALAIAVALLGWDAAPHAFPERAHDILGAAPLAAIAIAYLIYEGKRRPALKEWIKAVLLAIAFVFWAANQFWPDAPQAMLFNDIAVALFVLDVFLVIIGWPKSSPDEDFAEIHAEPEIDRRDVTSLG
jgi:peptidoglycan/LPS O-acetylase OafA/YrhL